MKPKTMQKRKPVKSNSRRARAAKKIRRLLRRPVRRRNQESGADFPFETVVEVEAVRFHKDGTVDLFLEDADIPARLAGAENRSRANKARKRKSKKR